MIPEFKSPTDIFNYIKNPANYKKARKKAYTCYVSMPKRGSLWKNTISGREILINQSTNVLISGTRGEYTPANVAMLQRDYVCSDGKAITLELLKSKFKAGCVDWFQAQYKPQEGVYQWACFIPQKYTISIPTALGQTEVNKKGLKHGLGDFIVCPDIGDRPNLQALTVVNGLIFADTYNNQGWVDCVETTDGIETPKPTATIISKEDANIIAIPTELKNKYIESTFNTYLETLSDIMPSYLVDLNWADSEMDLLKDHNLSDNYINQVLHYTFPYSVYCDYCKTAEHKVQLIEILFVYVLINYMKRNIKHLCKYAQTRRISTLNSFATCFTSNIEDAVALETGEVSNGKAIQLCPNIQNTSVTLRLVETKNGKTKTIKEEKVSWEEARELMQVFDTSENVVLYKKTQKAEDLLNKPSTVPLAKKEITQKMYGLLTSLFEINNITLSEAYDYFIPIIQSFSDYVTQNGLIVKSSSILKNRDKQTGTETITINGDDDDNLTLTFKIEINKTTWGVRVSGKSAKKTYNRYFPSKYFINSADRLSILTRQKVNSVLLRKGTASFALELFADVCVTLGVSPFRKFIKKSNYTNMPFLQNTKDYTVEINEATITIKRRTKKGLRATYKTKEGKLVAIIEFAVDLDGLFEEKYSDELERDKLDIVERGGIYSEEGYLFLVKRPKGGKLEITDSLACVIQDLHFWTPTDHVASGFRKIFKGVLEKQKMDTVTFSTDIDDVAEQESRGIYYTLEKIILTLNYIFEIQKEENVAEDDKNGLITLTLYDNDNTTKYATLLCVPDNKKNVVHVKFKNKRYLLDDKIDETIDKIADVLGIKRNEDGNIRTAKYEYSLNIREIYLKINKLLERDADNNLLQLLKELILEIFSKLPNMYSLWLQNSLTYKHWFNDEKGKAVMKTWLYTLNWLSWDFTYPKENNMIVSTLAPYQTLENKGEHDYNQERTVYNNNIKKTQIMLKPQQNYKLNEILDAKNVVTVPFRGCLMITLANGKTVKKFFDFSFKTTDIKLEVVGKLNAKFYRMFRDVMQEEDVTEMLEVLNNNKNTENT